MASQPSVFNVQEFSDLGALAAGYRLYTYTSGTTTLKVAYTDSAGTIPHTYTNDGLGGQYIALNARGELSDELYLTSGAYDLVLKDNTGVSIWTRTAVGSGDASATADTNLRADLANKVSASKGANLIGYSAIISYAEGVGLALGAFVNVRSSPFNAKGDGITDDTLAIQAAIDYVSGAGSGIVFFPSQNQSQSYKTTAPLTVNSAVHLIGTGPDSVTILATGLIAGQYVLEINCDSADNVENIRVEGLTLRSNNGAPHGMLLKNASYTICKDLRVYNAVNGISIQGTRCFSNSFEQVQTYAISATAVRMQSFSGGGQYVFNSCTFLGDTGFIIESTSYTDGLSFIGCNFEQCVTNSVYLNGNVAGVTFSGCRTEGCTNGDFLIAPASAKLVSGLSITGCSFDTDGTANVPIVIGGGGGTVRGFLISGNTVNKAGLGGSFVTFSGSEGNSGLICGNYFTQSNTTPVSSARPGVVVFGNENSSGACKEYIGLRRTQAAASTIASATTIAPTDDLTFISGTTTIQTITVPAGFYGGGGQLTLIPTGAWATNTSGNIANVITATANVPVIAAYDPTTTKWYVK